MNHFTRLSLTLSILTAGILPAAAATFTAGGLQYTTIDEATVAVKKYVEGSDIVVPSTVRDDDGNVYTVVAVNASAFGSAAVKSVSFPSTVTSLDYYAFNRSSVERVTFAEGLESIGYGAFSMCTSLSEVNLPASLKVLGAVWELAGWGGSAFAQCTSLTKITIPAGVTELPQLTFQGCTALTEVTLNEGLTTIGERVFEECTALKSLQLPSTVTTIERAAFMKTGLDNPVVPASIRIIPNSCYLWCGDMKSFTIEEGIVEVGKQAFADCALESVEVPASVEWIRTDAFQGNGNVKTIRLGSGLRRLGHSALAVWAPSMQANVPQWSLTDIYLESTVPPVHEQNDDHFDQLDDDFFFGGKEFTDELREKFYSEVKLHVPDAAVEAYRSADIWKEFKNINGSTDAVTDIVAPCPLAVSGGVATAPGLIEVYSVSGVRVAAGTGSVDLGAIGGGVYIVKAGAETIKAVVR